MPLFGRKRIFGPRPELQPAGEAAPWLWAVAGGVGMAAAFPPLPLGPLALVALAPLLRLLRRPALSLYGDAGRWFRVGLVFALVYHGIQFRWVYFTFHTQGGQPLVLVLGLYGLWVLLVSLPWGALFALCRWAWVRAGWHPAPLLALGWALLDALLARHPFGGVGWASPAVTQVFGLGAYYVAPVLGGAGVVALVVMTNALWAGCLTGRRGGLGGRIPPLALAAGLSIVLSLPAAMLEPTPAWTAGGTPFPVLVVPGRQPVQTETLPSAGEEHAAAARSMRAFLGDTLTALEEPLTTDGATPALIVWPEYAVAGPMRPDVELRDLGNLSALVEADLLVGAQTRSPAEMPPGTLLNSAYLVQGDGTHLRYDKRGLVPLGEYRPALLRWLMPGKLTAGGTDYTPGTGPVILPWARAHLGMAICSESMQGGHMPLLARSGAEVMVALANDAWLPPWAAWQHLRLTALRGLEVGRDVLWAVNGGPSALLRPGTAPGPLHGAAPAGGKPFIARPTPRAGLTPLTRWGGWTVLLLAPPLLLLALLGRLRP